MAVFTYSPVDFLFTCLGLVLLVLDVGLDVFAAVSFFQEKAYASLGVLLLLLLGSSVLVQAYSWLWYSYEHFKRETTVEKSLSLRLLKILHVTQLGIYIRHAGVVEISVRSFLSKTRDPEGHAVYLSHDLSMLRLIETFSESSPQLVLMLTIILQRAQLDVVTVIKALGSASAIAFSVTMYHRSLRSFLPDKKNQKMISSVFFFLWNLLLVCSRLVAMALFASVLPCFIFSHFFCSWLVLFLFAWRCKTDFMDSACGEWLYRATVGLIWYFAWFNVVEGRTRNKTLLYHGYQLADISLLCGLWYWKISTEPLLNRFNISHFCALTIASCLIATYTLGLLFKILYYKCCHPNLAKEDLIGTSPEQPPDVEMEYRSLNVVADVPDAPGGSWACPPAPTGQRCNKRMRKLAENFYS